MLRHAFSFASILFVASCASAVNGNDSGLADGGNVTDTGSDVGTSTDGGPAPGCPAVEPANGAACASEGILCTYGSDPALHCRDRAMCTGHAWQVTQVDCTGVGTCAPTPPSGPCTESSTVCEYDDGQRCVCTQCPGGPCTLEPAWFCVQPPSDPSCPRHSPQLGEACAMSGLECDYGACVNGWRLRCDAGVWTQMEVACPQ